jgi:hypothetical protein
MPTRPTLSRLFLGIAIIALALAFYFYTENQKSVAALKASQNQQPGLHDKIHRLENLLTLATDQLQASEKDAATLRVNLEKASANPPPSTGPREPITQSYVEARYKKARELAKTGNHAEALQEFLWCYDEGMPRISSYSGVRHSFLIADILKLSSSYPPALAALQDRRDKARQQLIANAGDTEAMASFSNLNRVLKDSAQTLQFYDQLPFDSPAKQTLGLYIYDELAAAQRYQEAAHARPYRQMLSLFEGIAEVPKSALAGPDAERIRTMNRTHTTKLGAGFVEVLAGAGQLDDARDLAELITAYDNSPEAKAVLNAAATKAGHADLFSHPAP